MSNSDCRRHLRVGAALLLSLSLPAPRALHAQAVTGSVSGSVTDVSGALISEAQLTLTAEATGAVRTARTTATGSFVFSAVLPGRYSLAVEASGFRQLRRDNVIVAAGDRVSLGALQLDVGTVTDSITVAAQGATVQTISGERSGVITSSQVDNLNVINRDFSALLTLTPGVVQAGGGEDLGDAMQYNVQGGRIHNNNIAVDGVPMNNLGNNQTPEGYISMDAVAEVKILTSNYQAEYGLTSGPTVIAVSKGGSRDIHGTAYWYKRHEQFNANNFFNNRNGIARPLYRYTTLGAAIGGPLFIPGKFNRDRNKLFWFFSTEHLRTAQPQPIQYVTMPTERERRGDFGDSRETNGALIIIRDPASGAPFPGNAVPANRISRLGQGYLNLLPLPNFFDTVISGRRYNYQFQESLNKPKRGQTLRLDYNLGPNTSLWGRYTHWWGDQQGAAINSGNSAWGWLPGGNIRTNDSAIVTVTHIVDPRTVLEASMGTYWTVDDLRALRQEDLERLNRTKSGVTIPQFNPGINPLNLVPNANFAGISNGAAPTLEQRFPLAGRDTLFIWNAAVTRTMQAHTVKLGGTASRTRNYESADADFNGTFNFNRDVNNPNNTDHPFANGLLGLFTSYTESAGRPAVHGRATVVEWFAQDSWKAHRRFTLDIGARFSWAQPYHQNNRTEAGFVPGLFDPRAQVRLIEPVLAGRVRSGRNPVTGEIMPAATIGAIASGSGSFSNGIVDLAVARDYPQGLRETSGLRISPRFGFAWDVFGNGKTAVRGGFGQFYEMRDTGGRKFGLYRNAPYRLDQTLYYGSMDTLLQSTGVVFPFNASGFQRDWPGEQTMNYSLGVQHEAGRGVILDVAYVGSLGRHLVRGRNLNSIPFGTNFNPANVDPTTNRPLAAAFLRPYPGYNNIIYYEYADNSSYHSLQTTASRRFTRGLEFGAAWTWSKAMNYADLNNGQVSNLISPKVWNYGKAGFDRTHILKLNWVWDVPSAPVLARNPFGRTVFAGWQVAGIGTFMSGAPAGAGLSFTTGVDITGSPTDSARPVVVTNPVLPKSERSFSRYFNTASLRAPAVGTFGNAPKDLIRLPGTNNWDVSLFKNFDLLESRMKLQFRAEFYNAFNHTQFAGVDTGARFDTAGAQVNARLGEITSAREPRRIQFALRVRF